jgi:acyl dehydratase
MTLDDLRASVGKELGVSGWREITQQKIDQFAQITGDDQWIHLDRDRAARDSPYGATIAHGFLTVGLLSSLINVAIEITGDFKMRVNYGFNRLRFTGAVPSGSRIRGRFTLQSIKEVDGGVEIAWLSTVEVEGRDKPALVAEWLGRTYY